MNRDAIINKLIEKNNYKSYLEIGLDDGKTFNSIHIPNKVSVDPCLGRYAHAKPTHKMTSDEFFKFNDKNFDIIFIDGLHESKQVYNDIINSLNVLNEGGSIVCHDMNPQEKGQQIVPRQQSIWTGDCWKAWVNVRSKISGLLMYVIDSDWGVGVIQPNPNSKKIEVSGDLTFENLVNNKKNWLNLISVEEFKNKLNEGS